MSGVLVVGDVITDIIVMPEGPMVRGSDRRATIRARPGGSGANQAVWLGSMGVKVKFVARVAAAELDANIAYFRSRGVEPLLVGDADAPSGVLISIVDADGERSFLTDRGANLNLTAADLPPNLLDGLQLLMVSGYSFFTAGPRSAVMAPSSFRGRSAVCSRCSRVTGLPPVANADPRSCLRPLRRSR